MNIDLHVHSRYTIGVSKRMNFETIIKYSKIKGLGGIEICDVLFEKFEKEVKENIGEKEPCFYEDIWIILCQEVQTNDRTHHLMIFESFEQVRELRKALNGKGNL